MWFHDLSLLRLPADATIDPAELESALSQHPLRSPGPLEFETRGFVSPFSRDDAAFTLVSQGAVLFCLGEESRLLPASVLSDAIAERIAEHEANTGRKPGKRLRNEFREAALADLLPRAFIKRARTSAYLAAPFLVVDTASDSAAEAVATAVRDALGSFPARPLACEASAALLMSEWLIASQLPEGFEFGDECELKDPSDQAMVARFRNHDLTAEEVREHARCGKQVTQLGLIFDGRIGFVLDAKLKLRRLHFLDIVADQLDAQDGTDEDQLLDAEFTLMRLELARLFARLDEVLRFVE
jgi:recombination associated protein RdgC